MAATVEHLLSSFIDQMEQSGHRYLSHVEKANGEGFPKVAKLFRAVIASEEARRNLFRNTMVHHAGEAHDYFICPHCGLIFVPEAPDQCPVDETPGNQFTKIS
jgi:rubrerythrin